MPKCINRLKRNADFYCRRCLEGNHVQSVLLIEPNVKLEYVPKFCYLGDTLGANVGEDVGGGSKSQSKMCLG